MWLRIRNVSSCYAQVWRSVTGLLACRLKFLIMSVCIYKDIYFNHLSAYTILLQSGGSPDDMLRWAPFRSNSAAFGEILHSCVFHEKSPFLKTGDFLLQYEFELSFEHTS